MRANVWAAISPCDRSSERRGGSRRLDFLQNTTSCKKRTRLKYRIFTMKRLGIAILSSLLGLTIQVQDEESFVKIPCTANTEKGLQYRKISWYKVEEGSDRLIGLVLKDLRTQATVLYKFANQSYTVENDYSLVLPEVADRDCGLYRCTLWPPVGHYIQDGDYEFYPLGCSKPQQQSKTVTGEKTRRVDVNSIHLFLLISVLLASANMALGYLIYRKKKWNKNKVYSSDSFKANSTTCSGDV